MYKSTVSITLTENATQNEFFFIFDLSITFPTSFSASFFRPDSSVIILKTDRQAISRQIQTYTFVSFDSEGTFPPPSPQIDNNTRKRFETIIEEVNRIDFRTTIGTQIRPRWSDDVWSSI